METITLELTDGDVLLEPCRRSTPDDTAILVDACLAQLRQVARLDDVPVLPPPPPVGTRKKRVALGKNAVRERTRAATFDDPEIPIVFEELPKARRPSRLPVVLCAFVALAAGVAAFVSSPLGDRPVVRGVEAHVTHAVHASIATLL